MNRLTEKYIIKNTKKQIKEGGNVEAIASGAIYGVGLGGAAYLGIKNKLRKLRKQLQNAKTSEEKKKIKEKIDKIRKNTRRTVVGIGAGAGVGAAIGDKIGQRINRDRLYRSYAKNLLKRTPKKK